MSKVKLKSFIPWAVALAILLLTSAIGVAVLDNKDAAVSAKSLAESIQRSRTAGLLEACRERNRRHDDTLRKLDKIIDDLPPGRRKEQMKLDREGTTLLIEAIVPRTDCDRDVRLRTALEPLEPSP